MPSTTAGSSSAYPKDLMSLPTPCTRPRERQGRGHRQRSRRRALRIPEQSRAERAERTASQAGRHRPWERNGGLAVNAGVATDETRVTARGHPASMAVVLVLDGCRAFAAGIGAWIGTRRSPKQSASLDEERATGYMRVRG
jgi:hypothetical protein